MVSVTHLILRFAIYQSDISDNHIKFEVSLHFLGMWPTVCHSILPRPLWLLRAKLLLSFSSLDSSRQEDYDRWYYFLVEKLRSKQKLLPVFCLLCFFSERKVQCCRWISVLVHLSKIKICTAKKTREIATVTFLCSSIVYVSSEQTKLYQNFKREKLEIIFKCYFVFWFLKTDWSDWVSVLVSVMIQATQQINLQTETLAVPQTQLRSWYKNQNIEKIRLTSWNFENRFVW